MISEIWSELSQYSIPEIIAVLALISYVILAARENRACWPLAFIGSGIYIIIFYQYQLYMYTALNIFYVVMAIYGWFSWKKDNSDTEKSKKLVINKWSLKNHLYGLLVIGLLTIISGLYLDKIINTEYPYLESFTTWGSLLATWMVVKKILENWLYWISLDCLSIYLYSNKELYFTAALFSIYIIISIYGYINWINIYKKRSDASKAIA